MSARAIVPVVYVCQQAVQADTDSDYKHTHKNSSPVRMASLNIKQFCWKKINRSKSFAHRR